jgi:hypothetical protein
MDVFRVFGEFYSHVNKGIYYICHPIELAKITWNFIDDSSFMICMIICLASYLGYLCGIEKCKRYTSGSILIFLAIKMLSAGGLGK